MAKRVIVGGFCDFSQVQCLRNLAVTLFPLPCHYRKDEIVEMIFRYRQYPSLGKECYKNFRGKKN